MTIFSHAKINSDKENVNRTMPKCPVCFEKENLKVIIGCNHIICKKFSQILKKLDTKHYPLCPLCQQSFVPLEVVDINKYCDLTQPVKGKNKKYPIVIN